MSNAIQRTKAQKALKVVSILVLIGAIFSVIVSIIGFVSGGGMISSIAMVSDGTDLSDGDSLTMTIGILLIVLSVLMVFSGIISFITAGFGFSAAKNALKANRAFIFGIVILVLDLLSAITSIISSVQSDQNVIVGIIGVIFSLIIPGLYVYFSYKIKNNG